MMSWGSAVEKAFSSCGQLNLLKTYLYFDIKVSFVGPDSGIICCFQASLVTVNHFLSPGDRDKKLSVTAGLLFVFVEPKLDWKTACKQKLH